MILGFTTSVGLEEMSIELIHQKFMAKLQLVATCKNRVDKDVCQRCLPKMSAKDQECKMITTVQAIERVFDGVM